MAKKETTYEGIKITVITSASSLMAYFQHPHVKGRQYQLKMTGVPMKPEYIDQAIRESEKEIRKVLKLPEPVTAPTT